MRELQKGLELSLQGEEADGVVGKIRAQMDAWGLCMPEVDPLVLDFGLGDFWRIGETEFWIANEEEAGYCGKFLFLFAGQTCPAHLHKEKLETFFIVKGDVRMRYAGKDREMSPGDVLRCEVGTLHEFTATSNALLLEVSRPSIISDNYFSDPRIPIGGGN